ncbi:MAG TPA: hypothetical protein PKY95_12440, partial [candidate division Zixibacteria bacterium]|nr:hypothetical protein [candidate division Zixibacteria bacterium]
MTGNRPKFRNSPAAALLLHLLAPGFGHFYWREYLFGVFIFLVLLMAGALFVLSLLIDLPFYGRLIIYGLPIIFYLISFGDLYRIARREHTARPQTSRRALVIWLLAAAYELVWPLAPLNFALLNAPSVYVMRENNLAPVFRDGDLLKASRLAYTFHTWFVNKPIVHALPDRFAVVRVTAEGRALTGIVLGLPGEGVEVVDGVVVVDGTPQVV